MPSYLWPRHSAIEVFISGNDNQHESSGNRGSYTVLPPLPPSSLAEFNHHPRNLAAAVIYKQKQRKHRNGPAIDWCHPLGYKPKGPIVALASFPGSGNTWLRYLLQQATGILTGKIFILLHQNMSKMVHYWLLKLQL